MHNKVLIGYNVCYVLLINTLTLTLKTPLTLLPYIDANCAIGSTTTNIFQANYNCGYCSLLMYGAS